MTSRRATHRRATFEEDKAGGNGVRGRWGGGRGGAAGREGPRGEMAGMRAARNDQTVSSQKPLEIICCEGAGEVQTDRTLIQETKASVLLAAATQPRFPHFVTRAVVSAASHFDVSICKMHFSSLSSHSLLYLFSLRYLLNPPKMMTGQETTLRRKP